MKTVISQRSIFMSTHDHAKIAALLDAHAAPGTAQRQMLEWKLGAAIQLAPAFLFPDVAAVHSHVNFLNLRDGLEYWVKLDYPGGNRHRHSLSLFAPVGAALIGLSRGQEFHWGAESGRPSGVRVIEVLQAHDVRIPG